MEKRESNSKANSTTFLKMFNDFKMKDQLRSDTSSMDGKIGEFLFCLHNGMVGFPISWEVWKSVS